MKHKLTFILFCTLAFLGGCVSTAVGIAAGTAVAVTTTAVKVPVKVGQAAIGVVSPDEEEDKKGRD